MFEAFKIYKGQTIGQEELIRHLHNLGYRYCDKVGDIGDFSRRGETIEVFPATFESAVKVVWDDERISSLRNYNLLTGELIDFHEIIIILPLSEKLRRTPIIYPKFDVRFPLQNFIDIKPGDFVVHIDHGIGVYEGIKRIRTKQKTCEDCIVIRYQDDAHLYVPYDDMHLVQKYIGIESHPPRIYKLGTNEWHRVKEVSRKGIWSMAWEFLEMQARRKVLSGFSFSADTAWQKELERSFPYQETPDQTQSTLEVKQDMESGYPMDRLICGDVGYGKTEVALRAAFKAVMDNKQVAILVPTTILAEQHYHTFRERMREFPVNIEMLSRFRSLSEQEKIVEGLKTGFIDIVIGTHRLLSGDIKFKDLGLVIIDEEQRFGVMHKERLKQLRLLVDVLTLTATPIPRTLYMSLMGARDMSIINTPPKDRLPIETKVCEYREDLIRNAILQELKRRGQIFFVHNRVEGIEKIASRLEQLLPQVRMALAHGQMREHQLEKVMLDFMERKIDVLVSTTIIESGIDIPNANTIIVNRADCFGLADLYQLKGRVGRFNVKAYAYFLIPRGTVLDRESRRRLLAIERHTELGSGFKIAMEDLQIRGAGNLLGTQQHGYINTIGFDLYCRILKEAIENIHRQKENFLKVSVRKERMPVQELVNEDISYGAFS
jgi:transcription-repair coupling factor (superfamily II helicase)